MEYAALHGDKQAVEKLRSYNAPFNKAIFVNTVRRGAIEISKWLRSQGYPWHEYAFICSPREKETLI